MTYTDFHGVERNTHDQPLKQLIGFFLGVTRRPSRSASEHQRNGADFLVRLARTIRARAFRERYTLDGYLRARLLAVDPPHCRCGKPGTRIIGVQVFCLACGPADPAFAEKRFVRHRRREAAIAESDRQFDKVLTDAARKHNARVFRPKAKRFCA